MKYLVNYILFFPFIFNLIFFGTFSNYNETNGFVKFNTSEESKCTDCHNDLMTKAYTHSPAKEGCDNCHGIKIKEHTENFVKGFALSEKVPELCYTCHDEIKKGAETALSVHVAIKDPKSCVACHSPHSSTEKKLLIAEEKQLCLSCHNKEITTGTWKIQNMQQVLKRKLIHPALDGGCLSCHKPHFSANNYLLKQSFPKGEYVSKKDSFALCFECHEVGLLRDQKTTSATSFRDGDKNLHFLHVNQDKGRNCILCHNVHATDGEHLIEDNVSFGNWKMPMKYKVSLNGGSCAPACHTEKKYTR